MLNKFCFYLMKVILHLVIAAVNWFMIIACLFSHDSSSEGAFIFFVLWLLETYLLDSILNYIREKRLKK